MRPENVSTTTAPRPEHYAADRTAASGDARPATACAQDVKLHDQLLAEDLRREQRLPRLVLATLTLVAAIALLHVLLLTVACS